MQQPGVLLQDVFGQDLYMIKHSKNSFIVYVYTLKVRVEDDDQEHLVNVKNLQPTGRYFAMLYTFRHMCELIIHWLTHT